MTHFLCDPAADSRPKTLSGRVVSLTERAQQSEQVRTQEFADGGPVMCEPDLDTLDEAEEAAYERLIDWSLGRAGARMELRRRPKP